MAALAELPDAYGQCHTRKRFVDFRCFIRDRSACRSTTASGARAVALILDNGSTHARHPATRWIQELAGRSDGKLTMQLYWLPTNARLS